MRVLFALREPFIPDVTGGGVADIHHMSLQLRSAGHLPEVYAALRPRRRVTLGRVRQRLHPARALTLTDTRNGYPVTRTAAHMMGHLLGQRLAREAPDVVVFQGTGVAELAAATVAAGTPGMIRIVTSEGVDELADLAREDPRLAGRLGDPRLAVVSNSRFVAARVRERLGLRSPVVYPLVDARDCVAPPRRRRFVTFINPVALKGLSVALETARLLPHREFLFLESWPLEAAERGALRHLTGRLPNVTLRASTEDIASVYAETALLLMPSQWEEAFGRVAVEAALNGIPQVASRIGGLPEAVAGGVLIAPDAPAELWAEAVEGILADEARYSELSKQARERAGGGHLAAARVCESFLELADELASSCGAARRQRRGAAAEIAEAALERKDAPDDRELGAPRRGEADPECGGVTARPG